MKSALHFGAGNIGRGFIGAILEQAGYRVTFADINQQIIDSINSQGGYTVHITDIEPGEISVRNVAAIRTDDPALAGQVAQADLVTTAVGLGIIPRIAPALAAGLAERCRRGNTALLDVIACENGVAVTSQLRAELFKHLTPEQQAFAEKYIGFPDCAVDRIVPPVHSENPADVSVERYCEWDIDRAAVKGQLPPIYGTTLVDNLPAYNERKLFTLNTGHAVTSYIGSLKGYRTVDEAIADAEIVATVRGAMQESGLALIAKYGFDRDAHFAYIEKIISRFRNPFLGDELRRVGREPLRKLSAGDRLIKPLTTAHSYGIAAPNLVKGIAAALCYDNPADPQSVQMQAMLASGSIQDAIAEITGLAASSPETAAIVTEYKTIIN
jgi:mannitol-1-phosphate 5-dehydrogenase